MRWWWAQPIVVVPWHSTTADTRGWHWPKATINSVKSWSTCCCCCWCSDGSSDNFSNKAMARSLDGALVVVWWCLLLPVIFGSMNKNWGLVVVVVKSYGGNLVRPRRRRCRCCCWSTAVVVAHEIFAPWWCYFMRSLVCLVSMLMKRTHNILSWKEAMTTTTTPTTKVHGPLKIENVRRYHVQKI